MCFFCSISNQKKSPEKPSSQVSSREAWSWKAVNWDSVPTSCASYWVTRLGALSGLVVGLRLGCGWVVVGLWLGVALSSSSCSIWVDDGFSENTRTKSRGKRYCIHTYIYTWNPTIYKWFFQLNDRTWLFHVTKHPF